MLLHGHCHDKSVLRFVGERDLLRQIASKVHEPDTGCCGMAGSFGFERGNYDVSQAYGERVLLPEVRRAGPDTLVVTDGLSCREQIAQNTDRRPVHLAQVLHVALERSGRVRPLAAAQDPPPSGRRRVALIAAGAAVGPLLARRLR